ncbi:MAG: hypothetical protein AB1916_11525 [Thermodesulfobacteriota bacterium]
MAASKGKSMAKGLFMTVVFFVVLFLMFSPLFSGGQNAFEYSDNLFNAMSKGSTLEYIPKQLKNVEKFAGKPVETDLEFKDGEVEEHLGYNAVAADVAANAGKILAAAGAKAEVSGAHVAVSGDLGAVLTAGLTDAQAMFDGKGEAIAAKYGMDPKLAVFTWWKIFRELNRKLVIANKANEAKAVDSALKKGIELGYNFAGIPAVKASDNVGILAGSLIFYVVYTMWWGLAILFVFEGMGLAMKKGKKKEV